MVSWLQRRALDLGVEAPGSLRCWLWRVFVLPPTPMPWGRARPAPPPVVDEPAPPVQAAPPLASARWQKRPRRPDLAAAARARDAGVDSGFDSRIDSSPVPFDGPVSGPGEPAAAAAASTAHTPSASASAARPAPTAAQDLSHTWGGGSLSWLGGWWSRPHRVVLRRLHAGRARWRALDFSPLAQRLEAWADAAWLRPKAVRLVLFSLAALVFWKVATTRLELGSQALLGLALMVVALLLRRVPGRVPTLVMIFLALLASARYGWWRITESMELDSGLETVVGYGLLAAEVYAWLILVLGFIQTIWPLKRPVIEMAGPSEDWPTVDVYVPTYNEPLAVVAPTVRAALDIDWPADKLRVYLLDDGRRPEMRAFAAEVGVHYVVRPDNRHAKAGNLNHAMRLTQGEYIAIFDCDHMPVRSFLKSTMGWMLKDPRCALVQTPHHFFSPDPFERNLDTFRRVPNEGELFYGLVQDGNDFWDATFFCGSCAVLRRTALDEVGGVAIETVTEDAHTALKLHRRGWRTAYLNRTLAAGLATESLSGHVAQRVRWARGMAQIFRIDNPLLGRGLGLMQRLCYSNAMLHFFYGLPRLIFLTAPLAYLLLGLHVIRAEALVILLYLLPHLVVPHVTNAHMAQPHRHSFWSDLYETVLAWYVAVPTTLALINPRLGKFNVTAKGGLIERGYLDTGVSRPYFFLVGLNLLGLLVGLWQLARWPANEVGTLALNLAWTVHNLLTLGAAIGVAHERRQVRNAHRVDEQLPLTLLLPDGQALPCRTQDYSLDGMGLDLPGPTRLQPGDLVQVAFQAAPGRPPLAPEGAAGEAMPNAAAGVRTGADALDDPGPVPAASFPARVANVRPGFVGLKLEALDGEQARLYLRHTFTRDQAWSHWHKTVSRDRALDGLVEIATLGARVYADLLRRGGQALWTRLGLPRSHGHKAVRP